MKVLPVLLSSLILLSSCSKGSNVGVEEPDEVIGYPETAEIYLLSNLDPGFVYPDFLQYMSSQEVNSSVCIDIAEEFNSKSARTGGAPMQSAASKNVDVDLDEPLQAHACHSDFNAFFTGPSAVSSDQGFDVSKISTGEFKLPFYNVCMEVERTGQYSDLILRECDKSPKQQFVFEDDGKIKQVNDLSLCLTASGSYSWYGGGYTPIYIVRKLYMAACNPAISERQSWGIRTVN
jgi:hypothetical protein